MNDFRNKFKNWLLFMALACVLMTPDFALAASGKRYILTSGTSWIVPADWNSSDNLVECIGPGGKGANRTTATGGGGGGGGGAYAATPNVSLTVGSAISYVIGTGGSQTDTSFNTSSCIADAGKNAVNTSRGAGGLTAGSTGTTLFAGGNGANGTAGTFGDGGGGGGAAGPNGAGNNASTVTGGSGDAGSGGAGGGVATNGGNGTEYDPSFGSGGGGGGARDGVGAAGTGGAYGAGGGGGCGGDGAENTCSALAGSDGSQGIIVITYTPIVPAYTSPISAMFRILGGRWLQRGGRILIK